MTRDIKDYLKDILDAISEIEEILKDISNLKQFIDKKEKVYSVIFLLSKIGEAVKKLPDDKKNKYPDIPWRDIAGMRDILLHEYFRTDNERVWETTRKELKPLYKAVEEILNNLK